MKVSLSMGISLGIGLDFEGGDKFWNIRWNYSMFMSKIDKNDKYNMYHLYGKF